MTADTPETSGSSYTPTASDAGATPHGSERSSSGVSLEPKMQRVVEGAHATIDHLAQSATPHVQRLESGLNTASEKMHRGVDHAREQADAWAEDLRNTVRANPLGAVVCAFGLGWLIARLAR